MKQKKKKFFKGLIKPSEAHLLILKDISFFFFFFLLTKKNIYKLFHYINIFN